tara:strand:- start:1110 stop:1613 length:504 start_codon:yes stop_codon:yes gene_type:complete
MNHYLEKKIADLEKDLNKKEFDLTEKNNEFNKKIENLEKDLRIKNEELIKQKLLEERIVKFEKRITDTEKLNAHQADLEIKQTKLENEVKKTSDDILSKNIDIEKKANYIEMKINSYDFEDQNKEDKKIAVNENSNDVVDLKKYDQKENTKGKKLKKRFFWPNISGK